MVWNIIKTVLKLAFFPIWIVVGSCVVAYSRIKGEKLSWLWEVILLYWKTELNYLGFNVSIFDYFERFDD